MTIIKQILNPAMRSRVLIHSYISPARRVLSVEWQVITTYGRIDYTSTMRYQIQFKSDYVTEAEAFIAPLLVAEGIKFDVDQVPDFLKHAFDLRFKVN